MSRGTLVRAVPADGLSLLSARIFVVGVMTNGWHWRVDMYVCVSDVIVPQYLLSV